MRDKATSRPWMSCLPAWWSAGSLGRPPTATASTTTASRTPKAESILANPPFNMKDWGGERLREDKRWKLRRASCAERQLRLGAARHPPSRADWRRELCARQRLDVVQAARRRAAQLREQQAQARKLDEAIWKNLKELGYGG